MSLIIGFHLSKKKTFLETVQQIPDLCTKNNLKKTINTAQIFTSSPQSSQIAEIANEDATATAEYLHKHDFPLFVHSKYIINLASPKAFLGHHVFAKQITNSFKIGAEGCIVHMGKSTTQPLAAALDNMENNLKKAMDKALDGIVILETSSGQGSEMLYNIDDLHAFYKRFSRKSNEKSNENYKKRIRFCIDTCHIFAAGYDIRTTDGAHDFLKKWKRLFGFKKLTVIHLNDSLGKLGSRVDRHAPVGKGEIGYEGLVFFCRFAKENGIPLILERGVSTCCPEVKKIREII